MLLLSYLVAISIFQSVNSISSFFFWRILCTNCHTDRQVQMKLSPESIKLLQTTEGVDEAQLEALLQRVASRIYGNQDKIG